MSLQHLIPIATQSTRFAIRSGTGIVFVFLAFYAGLWMAGIPMEALDGAVRTAEKTGTITIDPQSYIDQAADWTRDPLVYFLGGSTNDGLDSTPEEIERWRAADNWRAFLIQDNPALLTAAFAILIYLMPLLLITGVFNVLSGDVQNHALRYQLFRTTRASLYFGRYLGAVMFSCLIMALLATITVVHMGFASDLYTWSELISWGLRGVLAMGVLVFPYVALYQMISSWIDSPMGSMLICSCLVVMGPAMVLIGWWRWDPAINLLYGWPWGIHHYFFHPETSKVLMAVGMCVVYTVAYLFVGYWNFKRRDL